MNIYEITFSPTGGTKKIADFLAAELNREIRCIDLSNSNEDFHQFSMQLFRKSRQTLVFNKFKTCLKNSNTRKVQYCDI
jgi:flavodoxin